MLLGPASHMEYGQPAASTSTDEAPRAVQDEWLWGWDSTPGIVSVWAEADGSSLGSAQTIRT
jgi:hypothetical protein